jgi:hypothetical protein
MDEETMRWLLEKDNPSVRYFTLKYLLDEPERDRQVRAEHKVLHESWFQYNPSPEVIT